jgi:hypothetical protein
VALGGRAVEEIGRHLNDFTLDGVEFGKPQRVESVVEEERLVDLTDELFDVFTSRGVDQSKEATGVDVGVERTTTFKFGEDCFTADGYLVHSVTLRNSLGKCFAIDVAVTFP